MRAEFIRYFMGIDPGQKGAIAILDRRGEVLALHYMPLEKFDNSLNVDPILYGKILMEYGTGATIINIEKVRSRRQNGVTSTFNFGYGAGMLNGIARVLGFDVRNTRPQDWKGRYLKPKATKNDSLRLARKRYGKEYFKLQKDEGMAEACLIADYCREYIIGR